MTTDRSKPRASILTTPLTIAAAVSTLFACALLPIGSRRTPPPESSPPASVEPPVAPAASRPAPAQPARSDNCPANLTVRQDARTHDVRNAGDMPPDRYKKMVWAPGHRKPPAKDFSWADADAIERVIAIENAHPEIIPAGFRDEVRARPRDRALRLRMAGCELAAGPVRRRASYDAAMALLLGSALDEVKDVLVESTRNGEGDRSQVASCMVAPCTGGLVCEPRQRHCMRPEAIGYGFVSDDEIAIEEALSRALFRRYLDGERRPTSPLGWFLSERVHRCGTEVCSFRDYDHGGQEELVRWDLRDGGTVESHPCKRTPELLASVKSQELCRAKTGHWSQELCVYFCGDNEACRTGCYTHCKTEAALFYNCITDEH